MATSHLNRLRHLGPRAFAIAIALCLAAIGVVTVAQAKSPHTALKSEPVKALGGSVLADRGGMTLYRLKPETTKHLLCSSRACVAVWPPATVASKSTRVALPAGAQGKVGFLRRGKRFQLTFKGLPLYRFSGDTRARQAAGQHIHSFGGVWSVLALSRTSPTKTAPTTTAPPSSSPPQY